MDNKSAEVALLLTFLEDNEIQNLAKSEDFQTHIIHQKKIISALLKNGFALKSTINVETGNINTTVVPAPAPVSAKVYRPAAEEKSVVLSKNEDLTSPSSKTSENTILTEVTKLFAEKTGYPTDMLEPQLDLEADLGIDTVKQMEILGLIRKQYGLKLREGFTLKQTPNITSIVKLVQAG